MAAEVDLLGKGRDRSWRPVCTIDFAIGLDGIVFRRRVHSIVEPIKVIHAASSEKYVLCSSFAKCRSQL